MAKRTKTQKTTTEGKTPSFSEAVGEVEDILTRLEQDEVDIDKLGEEVRRAVELIHLCRQKLEKTDGEVRQMITGLQEDARQGDAGEGSTEDESD